MLRSSVPGEAVAGQEVAGEALWGGSDFQYTGSGGVTTGGEAETSATYNGVFEYDASGWVTAGGAAETDYQPTHDYEGSGGVVTGGEAGTYYTTPTNALRTYGRGVAAVYQADLDQSVIRSNGRAVAALFQADLDQTHIRTIGRGLAVIVLLESQTITLTGGIGSAEAFGTPEVSHVTYGCRYGLM